MSTVWTVYFCGRTHVFGSWQLAQRLIRTLAQSNPNERITVKMGQP